MDYLLLAQMILNECLTRSWRTLANKKTFRSTSSRQVSLSYLFSSTNGITKKFAELSMTSDLSSLASLCEALYTHSTSLDVIALHISIPSLLSICLNLIDSLDWESIGETARNIMTLADCVCR